MRVAVVVGFVVGAGCGRVGFDVAPDAAVAIDAPAPPPGMIVVPSANQPFDFQPGTPAWKRATLTHDFYLDRDEVTVARWSAWLAAGQPVPCTAATADPDGGCALDVTGHAARVRWFVAWNASAQQNAFATACGSPWGLNGSTYPLGGAQLPINCMTWVQAVAFCAWDGGKRLPTMLEYNFEARGGDHRRYVWGDAAPDCDHATYDAGAPAYCGFPRDVGSAPLGTSVHGARDLNGSVWEWGWDATDTGVLANGVGAPDEVVDGAVDYTGTDPGASADAAAHALFGGEWGEQPDNLDLLEGTHHAPGGAWGGMQAITTVGLRCARTAP